MVTLESIVKLVVFTRVDSLAFKDLKKRVALEATAQQQSRLFKRLQSKPFWIWDIEDHKREDIITKLLLQSYHWFTSKRFSR